MASRVGSQICRRPRDGLKCMRCTKLHKDCLPTPDPFEDEIIETRESVYDEDIDPDLSAQQTRTVHRVWESQEYLACLCLLMA